MDVSPVTSINDVCFEKIVVGVANKDLQNTIAKILFEKYTINSSMLVYPLNIIV